MLSAQWTEIHDNDLGGTAIQALNPDTVFALGRKGAIYSFDGGASWNDIDYENINELLMYDLDFPTPQFGYMAGYHTVIKTSDYGYTWQELIFDENMEFKLVDFISPDTGWIIGSGAAHFVMRTYDGGDSWDIQYPDELAYPHNLQMIDSQSGFIFNSSDILKTDDGGNTWYTIDNVTAETGYFFNEDTGIVRRYEDVIKSTDGGGSWESLGYIEWEAHLESHMQFVNKDTGYYVGYSPMPVDGIMATTTNGGYTWSIRGGHYVDLDMFNDTIGYCITSGGKIYKTTNGGFSLVGVQDIEPENPPLLFPNPFSNEITLNYPEEVIFKLYSTDGKLILHEKVIRSGKYIISTTELSEGIYFYGIENKKGLIGNGKLIKIK